MTSSSSVSSQDEMITSFPNSALPKTTSELHCKSLVELRDALKENYSSISSRRGGGTYGYLGGLQLETVYVIVAPGTAFVILPDPGQLIIPSGTISATSGYLHRNHAEVEREFKEWATCSVQAKNKSRKHLAKRFCPEYLTVIRNLPISG